MSQQQAVWIGRPGAVMNNHRKPDLPAPFFRRVFRLEPGELENAQVRICGLGFFELYLNGVKVDDRLFAPTVSRYDRHYRVLTLPADGLLKAGDNVCGVILGNGWYNCQTRCSCELDKAPWRDYPKLWLELETGGVIKLVSDVSWQVSSEGPIRFDALRNGEIYDARREFADWLAPDFDASAWLPAVRVHAPGGLPEPDRSAPCRVLDTLDATPVAGPHRVYDAGRNIAGFARITVRGAAGAQVKIRYAERLTSEGMLDFEYQDIYVFSGEYQSDAYTLRGGAPEVWEPRFTYHGFQYIALELDGEVTVEKVEARSIGCDFPRIGEVCAFDDTLDRLQRCTVNSFLANFVNIPTDCPHREKNGWTGDAQLACEAGLYNFDAAETYLEWLALLADNQRPNGQLPGIAPTAGWGYNWGSGPAWDSALFVIPEAIHRFTGSLDAAARFYDPMRRYLDYCASMAEDHIVNFGLGDWCHPRPAEIPAAAPTDTGYYYFDAVWLAACAEMLGREDDRETHTELAGAIRRSFRNTFRRADGRWGSGSMTETAAAVHFGLTDPGETETAVAALAAMVEAAEFKSEFGILGAKYIPRVLAEHGHADAAFRIFTQPEFPGWANWLKMGANTLWERWDGTYSRNHVMFGDISAWLYRYPGGLRPDFGYGRNRMIVEVVAPPQLQTFEANWNGYRTEWHRAGGVIKLAVTVPAHGRALVRLPDGSAAELGPGAGRYSFAATDAPSSQ